MDRGQDQTIKTRQIKRIMKESASTFTHANTARQYIELYEKMLQRPLIVQDAAKSGNGIFTQETE